MLTLLLIGAIGFIVLVGLVAALKDLIKLFLPRRLGPRVDQAFAETGRWLARILVIGFVSFATYFAWVVYHSN